MYHRSGRMTAALASNYVWSSTTEDAFDEPDSSVFSSYSSKIVINQTEWVGRKQRLFILHCGFLCVQTTVGVERIRLSCLFMECLRQ